MVAWGIKKAIIGLFSPLAWSKRPRILFPLMTWSREKERIDTLVPSVPIDPLESSIGDWLQALGPPDACKTFSPWQSRTRGGWSRQGRRWRRHDLTTLVHESRTTHLSYLRVAKSQEHAVATGPIPCLWAKTSLIVKCRVTKKIYWYRRAQSSISFQL